MVGNWWLVIGGWLAGVGVIRSYKDLDVWKRSIVLVKDVYNLIKLFPKHETYALSDQIRRSAVSIPSNIAEGSGRGGTKEFIQFLYIAVGSLCELETQLIIAKDIGYLQDIKSIEKDMVIIKKMLNSLITSLKAKI